MANQEEPEEHTNAWQAADNVAQSASNSEQAAGNVKQTADNVRQTDDNVRQSEANVRRAEEVAATQEASNVKQAGENAEQGRANERQRASHRRSKRIDYVQTGVYIFLAFVVVLALFLDQRNSKEDIKRLCQAGTDTRNVQRALVQEIYRLNLSLIDEDRKYSKEDLKRIDEFVKNVTEFRKRMYKQIKPSDVCAQYVEDVNVVPPKDGLPKIRGKGPRQ